MVDTVNHLVPTTMPSSDQEADSNSSQQQLPVFKKRNRRTARPKIGISADFDKSSSIFKKDNSPLQDEQQPEDTQTFSGEEDNDTTSVQDLIALRSLTRKPVGIDLDKLNKGDKKKKKKKKKVNDEQEKWDEQMKKGGLVSRDADGEGDGDVDGDSDDDADDDTQGNSKRLVRKDNFQGETGTVDVDKHMMAYIEEEMHKRRGGTSAADEADVRKAINDPEDELYKVAEKYKALQQAVKAQASQEEEEENGTLSAAMLSSIPEVDLGMDIRLKNIEATEKAKRALYEKRKNQATNQMWQDEQFAAARFLRPKHHTRSDTDVNRSGMSHQAAGQERQGQGQGQAQGQGQGQHPNGGYKRPGRREMASDHQVMERFKKRQRNMK